MAFAAETRRPSASRRTRSQAASWSKRDSEISASMNWWQASGRSALSHMPDFTLKKRYLVGRIAEVWFFDAASGRILAQQSARLP
jgi:hypothetical protein